MRIQQVIQQAPQRKRRQWLAGTVALASLAVGALSYALLRPYLPWHPQQDVEQPLPIAAAPLAEPRRDTSSSANLPSAPVSSSLLPDSDQPAPPESQTDTAVIRTPLAIPRPATATVDTQVEESPEPAAPTDEPAVAAQELPAEEAAPAAADTREIKEAPRADSAPEQPRLRINPQPENARVRIMNITPRYRYGMALPPGRYDVEVSKPGYLTERRWIRLTEDDLTLQVTLDKGFAAGTSLRSPLASGGNGPEMVVIGAGSYRMGSNQRQFTSPAQRIAIAQPFAISSHEITFDEYDRFADATGAALPGDSGWGRGDRPVINVAWDDARAYVRWLSRQTGKRYRLPSEAEWEYAARGGVSRPFWWGEGSAAGKANCRRGCDSEFVGIFRSKSARVGHYPANGFGLHDTAGNVAEWVQDCYVGDHSRARRDGGPVLIDNCNLRVVKGGSMREPLSNVSADYRKGLDQKTLSTEVGFRVVMELD